MFVNPNTILPSQDFLKPTTLHFIFACIRDRQEAKLPPVPIVRRDESGHLVAIDGHNLIAVRLFLKQKVEVQVVQSATDEVDEFRKDALKQNFDRALEDQRKVAAKGVRSFSDLVEKYRPVLEELKDF